MAVDVPDPDKALSILADAWRRRDEMCDQEWDGLFMCLMDWDYPYLVDYKTARDTTYPDHVYAFCRSWFKSMKRGFIANWDSSDDENKDQENIR